MATLYFFTQYIVHDCHWGTPGRGDQASLTNLPLLRLKQYRPQAFGGISTDGSSDGCIIACLPQPFQTPARTATNEIAAGLTIAHGRALAPFSAVLIVVSNREPYLHQTAEDGSVVAVPTTGGVAVALDALMRQHEGIWIAHGAGDADRQVTDQNDCVRVPPDNPLYTLHRIWLSDEEERRYLSGFANEGLWPLCHMVHVKPVFRVEDWEAYQAVNKRFADAVVGHLTDPTTPVFIQDYHMALVAAELRLSRPAARTALFWHIPWPHPDQLRICPWRRELMRGLLANDLLAFQLPRDRRNFLTAVRDELGLESRKGVVHAEGRDTHVVAAPIGIDFDRISQMATSPGLLVDKDRLRRELRLTTPIVGIGVDRLDYTKGIPERLDAIDRLLTARPDLKSELTFVQIGVPSRSKLDSYAAIEQEIDQKVAEVNARHGRSAADGPIRYRTGALKLRRLVALYQLADFCVVSSLHDGMNLVAKEFVAARHDDRGVLVLSELTGAAQELKGALIINPYDGAGFAQALEAAIGMPHGEQAERMSRMRRVVAGHDVFVWASEILDNLQSLTSKRRFGRVA